MLPSFAQFKPARHAPSRTVAPLPCSMAVSTQMRMYFAASPGTDGTTADYNFKGVSFAPVAPVPEPGASGMALGGLGILVAFNRLRRRS